jgi:hypothetical protein
MPLPEIAARALTNGQIPLRMESHPKGILAGISRWVSVPDIEHATLCRALQLDPCRFFFDLSSSFRGVGSNQAGAGGHGRVNRRRTGLVFHVGINEPVAKIAEALASDRFMWDYDPCSQDFWNLDRV